MGTIGTKQKRIRIEKATMTVDSHGASQPGWSPRCTVWAHERALSGKEALAAQQVTAVLSSVWEIWWRNDVSVRDRIRFGDRILQVEAVIDPRDTREELWLTCSETQS
jgi:SPP1 family predicted phage head-tail adaptor